MAHFASALLNILDSIKGSGSFVWTATKPFLFPGLVVEGVGEVGFPINTVQVEGLVKASHKAPFGKGSKTVLDTTVRSAWEINADKIAFRNNDWNVFVETLVDEIKPGLGIEGKSVAAHLYKLLIYEAGDFFVSHKDSEKEAGMFGTLIVGLPATHTGGELYVRFDGKTEVIDFAQPTRDYKIPYVAFYADCEHEIKPVASGYRVCLVYNLVQKKDKEKIELNQLGGYVDRLAALLKTAQEDRDIPKIVLLGHQYTPANFTMEALKLNDRPKAEALLLAAQKAGFYAKLGLVTSYQSGELDPDSVNDSYQSRGRRGWGYYEQRHDNDDELTANGTMGEVYDSYLEAGHWMDGGVPPLRGIDFEPDDLIASIRLNEDEPIEKEATGYTGNAGMEMTYWYHYGAVFLWPKRYQEAMLAGLYPANQLEWIAYYNQQWNTTDSAELALIKKMAETGLPMSDARDKADYSPLADWLINLGDARYLRETGKDLLLDHFAYISDKSWLKLFSTFPDDHFTEIFVLAAQQGKAKLTRHVLAVLNQLDIGSHGDFVRQQIGQIPDYLKALNLNKEGKEEVARHIVRYVLDLSRLKAENEGWLSDTTDALTRKLTRAYVNDVLVDVILKPRTKGPLAELVMAVCLDDLQQRVDDKPQPPADWSRPVPLVSGIYNSESHNRVWSILAAFLQSPVERVFEYRRNQGERSEIENTIRNVEIDLSMETIRKGSPHTLRLTKTQAAYEKALGLWGKDVALLKKAKAW